jgi:hypothetical protein
VVDGTEELRRVDIVVRRVLCRCGVTRLSLAMFSAGAILGDPADVIGRLIVFAPGQSRGGVVVEHF